MEWILGIISTIPTEGGEWGVLKKRGFDVCAKSFLYFTCQTCSLHYNPLLPLEGNLAVQLAVPSAGGISWFMDHLLSNLSALEGGNSSSL